jgi:hypothetical protein
MKILGFVLTMIFWATAAVANPLLLKNGTMLFSYNNGWMPKVIESSGEMEASGPANNSVEIKSRVRDHFTGIHFSAINKNVIFLSSGPRLQLSIVFPDNQSLKLAMQIFKAQRSDLDLYFDEYDITIEPTLTGPHKVPAKNIRVIDRRTGFFTNLLDVTSSLDSKEQAISQAQARISFLERELELAKRQLKRLQ